MFHAEQAFVGGNRLVPIATFFEFVGRRRELQDAVRALRQGNGIVLHGSGNLGKSSLAGRLARRYVDHHHVAIHGSEYTAQHVFASIAQAYQHSQITEVVNRTNTDGAHTDILRDALREIIRVAQNDVGKPLLLILDDFEQLLDAPSGHGLHRIKGPYVPSVAAIFNAFASVGGDSRLVMTSRYDFESTQEASRAMAALVRVPLEPFTTQDHQRQLWRLEQQLTEQRRFNATQRPLLEHAVSLAGGNPGLLRKLHDFVMTDEAGAPALLKQVSDYLAKGHKPTDSGISDYLQSLAVGAMLDRLDTVENNLLGLSRTLSLPVPVSVMERFADEALGAGEEASFNCHRLLSFGLWDHHMDVGGSDTPACAMNSLVDPLVAELNGKTVNTMWQALLPELQRAWPFETCSTACNVMLLEMALSANDDACVVQRAESAVRRLLYRSEFGKGHALAEDALPRIQAPTFSVLRIAGDLAIRAGEAEQARARYTQAMASASELANADEANAFAALLRGIAGAEKQQGDIEEAKTQLDKARTLCKQFNLEREATICSGDIADILEERGDLDEALRVRIEEELPVYEHLGDVRSKSATLYQLFGIYVEQRQLDKAVEAISEAFEIVVNLDIADGISMVGLQLGQVFIAMQDFDKARTVLTRSRDAFNRLGDKEGVKEIDALLDEHCGGG